MIIEEPLTAPRRPLWPKITFTCFILIVGASIASILYLHKHTSIEDTNQPDRILVVSRGYEVCSDDYSYSEWIINPFKASDGELFKRFKLSFEHVPKLVNQKCSVVWKNSMLMFGRNVYTDQSEITMLTGCTVKHFGQSLPSMISKAIYGFTGVCTTVQDTVMLCFGIRYDSRQCYQFELVERNFTINSFKIITESLFFHNDGTKIASINGC